MREREPFQADDLVELGVFFDSAEAIYTMEDVYDGYQSSTAIGLRHDCDNVIVPAVHLAGWEAFRGYQSTYYILHTAPYWQDKTLLRSSLEVIASAGHQIGIHNDAITVYRETGQPPATVLHNAIEELRGYGHTIRSTVAHGNARCHIDHYVNDEMFTDCYRPTHGDIGRLGITPVPLAEFGLEFDSNWLPRADYVSDSGGSWSRPFAVTAQSFPPLGGQLHMLVHPDWWTEAFQLEAAAA